MNGWIDGDNITQKVELKDLMIGIRGQKLNLIYKRPNTYIASHIHFTAFEDLTYRHEAEEIKCDECK